MRYRGNQHQNSSRPRRLQAMSIRNRRGNSFKIRELQNRWQGPSILSHDQRNHRNQSQNYNAFGGRFTGKRERSPSPVYRRQSPDHRPTLRDDRKDERLYPSNHERRLYNDQGKRRRSATPDDKFERMFPRKEISLSHGKPFESDRTLPQREISPSYTKPVLHEISWNFRNRSYDSESSLSFVRGNEIDANTTSKNFGSSRSFKDEESDTASKLLNLILDYDGIVRYSELSGKALIVMREIFEDEEDVRAFLVNFPFMFEEDWENRVHEIRAVTKVKLCPLHSSEPKSCNGSCGDFHLCKFHILSSCKMSQCKFGHVITDAHNSSIRRSFNLQNVTFENIKKLLRHIGNRCNVTTPVVCKFYNGKGCTKAKCPFLHICQKFVEYGCNGLSCHLNHKLNDKKASAVLYKYDLDVKQIQEHKIISLLKQSLREDSPTISNQFINREITKSSPINPRPLYMSRTATHSQMSRDKSFDAKGKSSSIVAQFDIAPIKRTESFTWATSDESMSLSGEEMRLVEEMYQQYLDSKNRTTTLNGKSVKIDFSTGTFCYEGNSKTFSIRRNKDQQTQNHEASDVSDVSDLSESESETDVEDEKCSSKDFIGF